METLRITIAAEVHAQIMHWVRLAAPFEVSGFGKIIRDDNTLHVHHAFLLPQENTPGSTVLNAQATAKALYELRDVPGDFNFWWHSHADMAAYFSGTDYTAMQQLGANGWLLSTVFNCRGETRSALYTKLPFPILVDPLPPITVETVLPEGQRDLLTKTYLGMVKNYVPKSRKRRLGRARRENWGGTELVEAGVE